ncbi:uncharacterized protein LOC119653179 [Hermetia illucens]|nr:uncharacterized protein LOC119653179 [Hermetia illucens]
MLLRKFAVVIGLLSVAVGYPSYSDLSKAIMSSMTNLWNEQQGQSPQDKIEADQFLIDYLYDGSSASVSNEKRSDSRVVETIPGKTKTTDVAKSNYMIYSTRRTKYPQTHYPKKQSTYNVKSTKKDRGPLYRALNGPNPVSFERLLHFYDYLDESYEDTSNSDPNCTKNIESMLGKFLKAITSVIKRPVVVNTNVCCPQTSPAQPNSDNLANPQPTTSKPPLLESLYTSLAQNSRYASNHKDIVEQLHRLLESIGHPREKNSDKKAIIPDTSENVPVQSLSETTPISTTISLEKETMQDTENSFPESTSTLFDVTSTTPPSQRTVTSTIEAKSAETEMEFPSILDDNFYSTPPSTQLPPESQTYQTTDTTTGDGSSAEAATEADSTKLKRKKTSAFK